MNHVFRTIHFQPTPNMKNFLKASALVAVFAATLTSCEQKAAETTTATETTTMDATTTPMDTTVTTTEVAPVTTETAPATTTEATSTTTTTTQEVK